MRERFYGRDGKPLQGGLLEWARLMEDNEYKIVRRTMLEDGTYVSTVWLGLDHAFYSGPPIIFESMVFSPEKKRLELLSSKREYHEDLECLRYSTEAAAIKGHDKLVAKWKEILELRKMSKL